jgi:hypothetical protein
MFSFQNEMSCLCHHLDLHEFKSKDDFYCKQVKFEKFSVGWPHSFGYVPIKTHVACVIILM